MLISVINCAQTSLSDSEVQRAIRAVNRQIVEDFAPHWSRQARLRLEGQAKGSSGGEWAGQSGKERAGVAQLGSQTRGAAETGGARRSVRGCTDNSCQKLTAWVSGRAD